MVLHSVMEETITFPRDSNSALLTFFEADILTWTIECTPTVCIAWLSSSDAMATKLNPRKSWCALALGGIPGESEKHVIYLQAQFLKHSNEIMSTLKSKLQLYFIKHTKTKICRKCLRTETQMITELFCIYHLETDNQRLHRSYYYQTIFYFIKNSTLQKVFIYSRIYKLSYIYRAKILKFANNLIL